MNPQALHQLIFDHFSHSELVTLCYALDIPEGSLRHETDQLLVTDILAHCQHRERLPALLVYCREQRPALFWPDESNLSAGAGNGPITACLTNLPPRNPHFVGRAEHLAQLNTGSGQTTITQAISGMGGVGKSQLMLAFAHGQRALYDVIWWLRVDEALAEDFLALGRQVGLTVDGVEQAAAVQMVRTWLNGSAKRWLLLCDNADAMEPRALRAWLPANPQGRVLITSRSPHWHKLGAVLRLDVFTEAEAWDFWRQRFVKSQRFDKSSAAELAKELGYLPLALEQAAAYADVNGLDAAGYLDLYRARRRELWQRQPAPDDYHATITTTWEIGFEGARQTAGSADLLNLCCFLAPDDIPLELLADHAANLPDDLAAVLADPLARNEA
ncbi:MAG: NB-ARC domain-containing protein, partial [Candidatus Promineifilaceae bacterium]